MKSSYFSIVAFVAYAFGVTYIKSLLRPMFTTSPGCFFLVRLQFQILHLNLSSTLSLVFYVVLVKGTIAIFGIQISSCPRQVIEEMVR